ncbi:hypothetical protein LOTGIDRAFT_230173 [Lottia gigantea]|uniref:Uncharacterized protein n=1 Tax=Lottia gigantea TaxID=225164 RepID=V4CN82_LOTGI|nr:hypothetical protein LOTGIDRAFT_230173 [Lottia gigantea]ESP03830.1 hypothetical protein LOTGIDRAFT_230173 [Lottia gigantea]
MANAYHMDALRKQRVLDRKNDALRRMMNAGSEDSVPGDIVQKALQQSTTDGLVTTDMGQYSQVRLPKIDKVYWLVANGNNNKNSSLPLKEYSPLPASFRNIKRDTTYTLFHSYEFYQD